MSWRRGPLALLCLALLLAATAARAERIVFQRGPSLLIANPDGSDTHELLSIGAGNPVLWAVSPDGRRLAWLKQSGETPTGLSAQPATAFLADITGRRSKKLFVTNALRDRRGNAVTAIGSGDGPTPFSVWTPISLAFSADGRTLYLSCAHTEPSGTLTTVAVDAATGYALVDGAGRWKEIAAVGQIDAHGPLIAAVSAGRASSVAEADAGYAPLTIVNLGDATTETVPSTASLAGGKPPYESALTPAISPDGKAIAFAAATGGIWLTDVAGKNLRRLVTSDAARPRWSADGKTLFFLFPRPSINDRPAYDLYTVTPGAAAAPQLRLQNVDWFDIVAD
jgi:hypothetical protein